MLLSIFHCSLLCVGCLWEFVLLWMTQDGTFCSPLNCSLVLACHHSGKFRNFVDIPRLLPRNAEILLYIRVSSIRSDQKSVFTIVMPPSSFKLLCTVRIAIVVLISVLRAKHHIIAIRHALICLWAIRFDAIENKNKHQRERLFQIIYCNLTA